MIPQFDVALYPSQIFWLIMCFTALYFFNAKFFLPFLVGKIKTRNALITELTNTTTELLAKCKEKEEQINQLREKSIEESYNIKLLASNKTQKLMSDEMHKLNEIFAAFLKQNEAIQKERLLKLEKELPKIINEIKTEYIHLTLK